MIEWLRLGIAGAALLFSAWTFFYVQRDRRDRATTSALERLKTEVESRLNKKSDRISNLEQELGRMPTRHEWDNANFRMEDKVTRLHERVDALNKESQQTNLLLGQVLGEVKQLNSGRNHG